MAGGVSRLSVTEHDIDASSAKTPLRLWLKLLSLSALVEGEIRRRLRARFDMSLAKFDYLAQLYRSPAGGLSMSELGRQLMVTGGNITGLTDRLEKDGLVERRQHPSDRRSQLIVLTARGRNAFVAMAAEHEAWVRELFADLGEAEQREIVSLLGTLKQSVQERVERNGEEA